MTSAAAHPEHGGAGEGAGSKASADAGSGHGSGLAAALLPDLGGDFPCGGCGYNLRGLSVRSLCPECGTAVRATILLAVDPQAEELAPITLPKVTAFGLAIWAWSALLAAVCLWGMRITDLVRASGVGVAFESGPRIVVGLLAVSAVCSFVLIRPHARVPRATMLRAILGAAMMLPLVGLFWYLLLEFDPARLPPYAAPNASLAGAERSLIRLAIAGATSVVILGLWPAATSLIARSVVIRSGRVDTQPSSAMLAALGLAALGDVVHLAQLVMPWKPLDVLSIVETVLIAMGSFLFTLTLIGLAVDTIRVRKVLMHPPISLRDVLEGGRGGG
ncbi:MAG: hypothetical protein AAGI17_04405 [Planctomycetota bacterium]